MLKKRIKETISQNRSLLFFDPDHSFSCQSCLISCGIIICVWQNLKKNYLDFYYSYCYYFGKDRLKLALPILLVVAGLFIKSYPTDTIYRYESGDDFLCCTSTYFIRCCMEYLYPGFQKSCQKYLCWQWDWYLLPPQLLPLLPIVLFPDLPGRWLLY